MPYFPGSHSRHAFHCVAAAATQILRDGNTHERLSRDFDLAKTLRIAAPIALVPFDVMRV